MFELIVLDWYLAFFLDRCLWPQPYMILYQENFDFLPVNEVSMCYMGWFYDNWCSHSSFMRIGIDFIINTTNRAIQFRSSPLIVLMGRVSKEILKFWWFSQWDSTKYYGFKIFRAGDPSLEMCRNILWWFDDTIF